MVIKRNHSIQRGILYQVATNSSVVADKISQQERKYAWYWKIRQLLRTSEVMDLCDEPTATILLNWNNS